MIQKAKRRPRASHLELAQRILGLASQRGMAPGAHLPEQVLAELCSVSRTPVRAALALLAERGHVTWKQDSGFSLSMDRAGAVPLPASADDELAASILRDRAARRMDETTTVSALSRRYKVHRNTVQMALKKLESDDRVERGPGQAWVFSEAADSFESQSEAYDFRLVMEPAAILAPGFRLDMHHASDIRQRLDALLDLPEARFDIPAFETVDIDFHTMLARSCGNRFMRDALLRVLKQRRLPGIARGQTGFRLLQASREHLQILDHVEGGQLEVACDLLRVHLRLSARQRPQAASRGVPTVSSFGAMAGGT